MRLEATTLRIRICLLPEVANRDNTYRPLEPSAAPRYYPIIKSLLFELTIFSTVKLNATRRLTHEIIQKMYEGHSAADPLIFLIAR